MKLGCVRERKVRYVVAGAHTTRRRRPCQDDLSVAGAHVVPGKGAGLGRVLPTAACDPSTCV